MVKDYALSSNGGHIVMATSSDERHPPEAMLDGKDDTFWVTTGLYPQEFVIKLDGAVNVDKLTTLSQNVKQMRLERCQQDPPTRFEKVFEKEIADNGELLQTEHHQLDLEATYLKFVIVNGYSDFSTISRVSILGEAT